MFRSVCCIALLAATVAAPAARAETINCMEITSLPATLTSQGIYCLRKDLTTAMTVGDAITIAANNVTIDCNGYKIGGLGAGPGTSATAINSVGRLNATVRNCNIRGFRHGIQLYTGGGGHLVENNRLDQITAIGIDVTGEGNRIRGNALFDIGGAPSYNYAIAINAMQDVEIVGNSISGMTSTGPVVGIALEQSDAGLIADNRVVGLAGGTWSGAIVTSLTTDPLIRGNHLGGPGTKGIECGGGGHAVGNQVIGFTTALAGACTNSGNYLQP